MVRESSSESSHREFDSSRERCCRRTSGSSISSPSEMEHTSDSRQNITGWGYHCYRYTSHMTHTWLTHDSRNKPPSGGDHLSDKARVASLTPGPKMVNALRGPSHSSDIWFQVDNKIAGAKRGSTRPTTLGWRMMGWCHLLIWCHVENAQICQTLEKG